MNLFKTHWRLASIVLLVIGNICVWSLILQKTQSDVLKVYFFDVGQGDAILIDSPAHGQVLIDGGPDRSVLSELGKVMPFGDNTIDVVIETHPDKDHIAGLPEVINRYNVGAFIEPGVEADNEIDDELKRRVEAKNIPNLLARRGMVIDFNDDARLDILFPNSDVSKWETNDASIIAKLTYNESSFLFTGDAGRKSEFLLMSIDTGSLDSDVLKAGHHGSDTSTSRIFAEAVTPEYAVISAGRNNSYGHPHQDVIEILKNVGARIVSTQDLGTIMFETDGKTINMK